MEKGLADDSFDVSKFLAEHLCYAKLHKWGTAFLSFLYVNISKSIQEQLNANKITQNSIKTEIIVFQKPRSKIDRNWNIRLNGYKLTLSDQIKYLGIYLDKYLNMVTTIQT